MKHTHSHFNLYSCTVQWQKGKLPRAATLNSIKLYWILCMTPFEFKNNQLNEECIGLCMYSITPKSIQATCTHFCSVHKKKAWNINFHCSFHSLSFFFLYFWIFVQVLFCWSCKTSKQRCIIWTLSSCLNISPKKSQKSQESIFILEMAWRHSDRMKP